MTPSNPMAEGGPPGRPTAGHSLSPALAETLAGGFAGGFSRTLVAPLDVLKIRFQLQVEPIQHPGTLPARTGHYSSMRQAVLALLREEGIRTLWRGNASATLLWVTFAAIQFPVYRSVTRVLHPGASEDGTAPPTAVTLAAGASAATAATILTYPLDWMRTRLAAQGVPKQYSSSLHLLRSVWAELGPRGYFQGLGPTLVQVAPNMAATFFFYERAKVVFDAALALFAPQQQGTHLKSLPPGRGGLGNDSTGPRDGVGRPGQQQRARVHADCAAGGPAPAAAQPLHHRHARLRSLLCGATAGVLGKLLTYPLDTVKKRLQVAGMQRAPIYGATREYGGTLHALRTIAMEEGVIRGLYKGTAPSLLKAAFSAATTFWAYDFAMSTLTPQRQD